MKSELDHLIPSIRNKREEIESKCDAAMIYYLLDIIDSFDLSSPSVVKDLS
jgi:hypothetical protein